MSKWVSKVVRLQTRQTFNTNYMKPKRYCFWALRACYVHLIRWVVCINILPIRSLFCSAFHLYQLLHPTTPQFMSEVLIYAVIHSHSTYSNHWQNNLTICGSLRIWVVDSKCLTKCYPLQRSPTGLQLELAVCFSTSSLSQPLDSRHVHRALMNYKLYSVW